MMAETNPYEELLQKHFPELHFYVERRDGTFIINYDTDATEHEVEQIKALAQRQGYPFKLERIPF